MKSTAIAQHVTFSAGARVLIGAYQTPISALPSVGLIGTDFTFTPEQTVRQKMDHFPSVVVAEAIEQHTAQCEMTLREFNTGNLKLGLGLEDADVTTEAGGDTVVTDEPYTFNADNFILLNQPVKAGAAITVTDQEGAPTGLVTYVEGTDYFVAGRDVQGRTLIYRTAAGAIPAAGTVYVDYTYNLPTRTIMPIGKRASVVYKTVKVEEELTNGGKHELIFWKARVGFRGGLNLNAEGESSADLPMVVEALYDPAHGELAQHINYEV